jgi:hypothetical protein
MTAFTIKFTSAGLHVRLSKIFFEGVSKIENWARLLEKRE